VLAAWTSEFATTWAGTIPSWLLFALGLFAAWSFRRAGGSTAIKSLEDSGRVLEHRVIELEAQLRERDAKISELQAKTDVALAIAPVLAWAEGHERRAQERHDAAMSAHRETADAHRHTSEAQIGILQLIADSLPADEGA
jgi:hypothetical protein